MNAIGIIATDLFDKVRSRFTNLQMGDESGNVTVIPEEARFFDFDFTVEGTDLGRVSISINDTGNLKIFYSQGITENSDPDAQHMWYDFLREMRFFAKRRLLRFDTRDIAKGNLDKTDFQYLAQNKPKEMNMNESSMYGSLKTSRRTLENTNLIIRHSEAIDPTKPGARSRKINKLYIENVNGERFLLPHNHLPYGRAMQRHVANGGYPYDAIGEEITKTCGNIIKLSEFSRKTKHTTLNDSAHEIVERAGIKLRNLRMHMESLSKQKYYESWTQELSEDNDSLADLDEATFETYKSTFTVTKFDEELAEVFPLLHSIMQEAGEIDLDDYVSEYADDDENNKSTNDGIIEFAVFDNWASSVIGESLSDEQISALAPLMQQPFLVGANNEAEETLLGLGIDDPKLIDAIHAIAAMPNGAKTDVRDLITTYLGSDASKLANAPAQPPAEPTPAAEPAAGETAPEPTAEDNEDSIVPDDKHKLIEPESGSSKMKEVAKIVSGFYNRQDGTWTRGEHGVVTHVKRQFANDKGKGGEEEAKLAAQLIKHLNQKNANRVNDEESINEGWKAWALGAAAFLAAAIGGNELSWQYALKHDPQVRALAEMLKDAEKKGDQSEIEDLKQRLQQTYDHNQQTGHPVLDPHGNAIDPRHPYAGESVAEAEILDIKRLSGLK